jgi:hypothetical protein
MTEHQQSDSKLNSLCQIKTLSSYLQAFGFYANPLIPMQSHIACEPKTL